MPGYPNSTSVTVTDVMATIDPAVGNVAKKYVWLVNIATGVKYGPSAATDSSGNWSLAAVDQGIYETFYAGESPVGAVPTQWTTAGVKGYLVSIASNPATSSNGLVTGKGGLWFDVFAYQAKGDAQEITDAVMSAASGVVTSASNKFVATDVGKKAFVRLVGAAVVADPTVAIICADGGAGATTLPTGTYKFAYDWAIRGFTGATSKGTSEATYVQTVANHKITLTVPSLPTNAEITELFCTQAPGGAFTGLIGYINGTTFTYTTGNASNARLPAANSSAGATIATTIASYQSAGQVTLAATATLASPGTNMLWGTDDSAARDAAVAAAVAAKKGRVLFPALNATGQPAAYLLTTGSTINLPLIYVDGGTGVQVKQFYTGSADCWRVFLSPFDTNGQPGTLSSLDIDGNYAGDGASGIHYGDANQGAFVDITVRNFNGVGSKGIWMDNRTNWCERHVWDRVWLHLNTIGALFDVNAAGSVSFAHAFLFNTKGSFGVGQTGIQLQNGAALVNSLIHLTGNVDTASTTIKVLDTATLGYSTGPNQYVITMEMSGTSVYGSATGLDLGANTNMFGQGVISLAIGNYTNISRIAGGLGNLQISGALSLPGIFTATGPGITVISTTGGLAVRGSSSIISDPIALQLQRTTSNPGGQLAFADQIGGVKARIWASNADNHGIIDDGTTERIGWSTTGLGFYGVTPVARAGAITTPNTQTASYVQADVASLKTAIDAIRTALTNIGITS